MADLLGVISISFVCFITLLLIKKKPEVSNIIFVALFVRILVMFFGYYFIVLPDSNFDALGFEKGAWERSQEEFFDIISYPKNSNFIKSIIAIPYSIFGRSLLMAQSISLFFGIASVYLGWLLAKKLWDEKTAKKCGWILALFPSLILYSVLTLREIYACFFLLVALHGVVNWCKDKSFKSLVLAILGFVGGTIFHGAIIVGAFVFAVFVVFNSFKELTKLLSTYRINLKDSFIILSAIIFLIFYFTNQIFIPKLGTFEDSINTGRLLDEMGFRLKGDAAYPYWMKMETPFEIFYKGLVRIIYLLFSPFPWDVKEPVHLIGMFDGLLYLVIIYFILRNIKTLWKDPILKLILIILICYFFIFGVGVSNFGAGTRHRSKFVVELIILAAPFIPRFTFFKKNKV